MKDDNKPLDNPEVVLNRLLAELRQQALLLEQVRYALCEAGLDLNLLTLPGAVKRLVLDRHDAIERARHLEREVQRLKATK